MKYVLDSNILLYIVRNNLIIDLELRRLGVYKPNTALVSIVSVAEILSISMQNTWGDAKKNLFESLIKMFKPIPIINRDLLNAYVEIDTYSRGKLIERPLPRGHTARTMGKNDLWIAATTYLTQTDLITNDSDFDHLDGIFFNVIKLSPTV
jgi:tRNA(fMet)-specific endonuclease VapC